MFKINGIKIVIQAQDGEYGAELQFKDGLNIVRGDNTSGKSSLFQGILYSLGFEELLKSRNANAMQYVYKDTVINEEGIKMQVLQSYFLLEVVNSKGEIITIKRFVKSENKDPKLVEVFSGNGVTGKLSGLSSKHYFVHDGGSATNIYTGFFSFLAGFFGWDLPEVLSKEGKTQKIYLQQIAPSFLIEQKAGWSDFLSTIPYYGGITGIKGKVIEFILKLDISERQKQKQEYLIKKRIIEEKWSVIHTNFSQIASEINGKIQGLSSMPVIIEDFESIQLLINSGDKNVSLGVYNGYLFDELAKLQDSSKESSKTVQEKSSEHEEDLTKKSDLLGIKNIQYDDLIDSLSFDRTRLENYMSQLNTVEDDLEKTKGAVKIQNLGANFDEGILTKKCPVCHSPINDSLLSCDMDHNPMRLDENLEYLKSQKQMLSAYIDSLRQSIAGKENEEKHLRNVLGDLRQEIRFLKRELTTDDRLPSAVDISNKIRLESKLNSYTAYQKKASLVIEDLKKLNEEYKELKQKGVGIVEDFSEQDKKKLNFLSKTFRELLKTYGYQSETSFDKISISNETYLPVVNMDNNGEGGGVSYNIISYSSGSDMIRAIWAYSIALQRTSIEFQGNHPGLVIFDEPKQQEASISDFRSFIQDLSTHNTGQLIVLASFENNDNSFNYVVEGITFNPNRIGQKLIRKITNPSDN